MRLLFACLALLALTLGSVAGDLLWPKPAQFTALGGACAVDASAFTFVGVGQASAILDDAIVRYNSLTFVSVPAVTPPAAATLALSVLAINVTSADMSLTLDTDESYELMIPAACGTATLTATTVFGALHGLERFSQLMDWSGVQDTTFVAPAATIVDAPRFPHRGALVDTARHFIPLPTLYAFIDALAYTFMNVLHWHIVDDQSFPYYSHAFPALSANGAWAAPSTTHVYSQVDVQRVIQYAYARGVRVLIEFDTPGHTLSWGAGVPGLLTQCYDGNGQPIAGQYGPIDPTSNATWAFLPAFFAEVATVFPDAFIFLGGDEVSFACWQSNPQIAAWMSAHGYGTNYTLLESYYEQRLLNIVGGLNKSYIVWQEVFDNGLEILPSTVVSAWKGGSAAAGLAELTRITAAGFRGILSAGWYLNYIAYGPTWQQYYVNDPQNFTGTAEQKALVIGGETAVWGEYVDATNLISRQWPFGAAVGERLWSPANITQDLDDAAARLHVHRCRILNRGITAEPANGPSFCPQEYTAPYTPPFRLSVPLF